VSTLTQLQPDQSATDRDELGTGKFGWSPSCFSILFAAGMDLVGRCCDRLHSHFVDGKWVTEVLSSESGESGEGGE
jgi:hypothetical protein